MKNSDKAVTSSQAYNPYLPSYEYIPDAEPYVFGDRVYIYGSHDTFNGKMFCSNKYVCWSAPVDDLANWQYEGVIYNASQDKLANKSSRLFAPDVAKGVDGRYYLYYSLNRQLATSIAVSNSPSGPFEFYGYVTKPDGSILGSDKEKDTYQFDPAIFVDDDNKVYLYTGMAPRFMLKKFIQKNFNKICDGAYVFELASDMKSVISQPKQIMQGALYYEGFEYKGHEFFEASSMRKINDTYYFIYSSVCSHELCYMTSTSPVEGFQYGGTIVSNGDYFINGHSVNTSGYNYAGNNHGSIIQIKEQWYVFYHRQTNKHAFSRQAMAEKINIEADGSIKQVEVTSCGLNLTPLRGEGEYEARIACNLMSAVGTGGYGLFKKRYKKHPYFTQDGIDRENNPNQYIANISNGCRIGYKYFDINNIKDIEVTIKGNANGIIYVKDAMLGNYVGKIFITPTTTQRTFKGEVSIGNGTKALFFEYEGTGSFNFYSFTLLK